MKKIFILSVLFLTLVSCSKSKNEEVATNTTPTELIGTWKFVGYYDDIGDPATNSNYHPLINGDEINFNANNTFISNTNTNGDTGTYSVSTDSVLTYNYFATNTNPSHSITNKIERLTNTVLEIGAYPSVGLASIYKYEKVVTTTTISGKK